MKDATKRFCAYFKLWGKEGESAPLQYNCVQPLSKVHFESRWRISIRESLNLKIGKVDKLSTVGAFKGENVNILASTSHLCCKFLPFENDLLHALRDPHHMALPIEYQISGGHIAFPFHFFYLTIGGTATISLQV